MFAIAFDRKRCRASNNSLKQQIKKGAKRPFLFANSLDHTIGLRAIAAAEEIEMIENVIEIVKSFTLFIA
jgi:hypothetical protein